MPAAVKIKENNYGDAILLLAKKGGTFQTQHERTLIVDPEQKRLLEEAGFVESNGSRKTTGSSRGQRKKSR